MELFTLNTDHQFERHTIAIYRYFIQEGATGRVNYERNLKITMDPIFCIHCSKKISERHYLTCRVCKNSYHLDCTNVSDTRYYLMTLENKKLWKCQLCYTELPPKDNNAASGISMHAERGESPDQKNNITFRNKANYNSNDSLSSQDISLLGDTIIMNKEDSSKIRPHPETELTLPNLSNIIITQLKENNMAIIKELQNIIQTEINKAMDKFQNEVKQNSKTLSEQNDTRKQEIQKINIELETLKTENVNLKKEIEELRKMSTNSEIPHEIKGILENDNRKKIVLFGLAEYYREPEHDLHNRIVDIFRDIFDVDLIGCIEDTQRIGKYRNNDRPLVIKLLSKKMAQYILNNRHYFQGTQLSVSEYLDQKSRQARKTMREKMFSARKEGLHAIIRDNKLFIDGQLCNQNFKNENSSINENTANISTADTYNIKNSQRDKNPHNNNIFFRLFKSTI